jgi:hypothetical protein
MITNLSNFHTIAIFWAVIGIPSPVTVGPLGVILLFLEVDYF